VSFVVPSYVIVVKRLIAMAIAVAELALLVAPQGDEIREIQIHVEEIEIVVGGSAVDRGNRDTRLGATLLRSSQVISPRL
jgi:hypothetical protein